MKKAVFMGIILSLFLMSLNLVYAKSQSIAIPVASAQPPEKIKKHEYCNVGKYDFCDDFEGDKMDSTKWIPNTSSGLTDWTQENGFLGRGKAVTIPEFSDFVYETRVSPAPLSSGAGPVFRYQDRNNYYLFQIRPARSDRPFGQIVPHIRKNGTWIISEPLWSENITIESQKFYNYKVIGKSNTFSFYINEILIGVWTDYNNSFPVGKIGFRPQFYSHGVLYDYVRINDMAKYRSTLAISTKKREMNFKSIEKIIELITEGVGKSEKIPPGLLTANGIEKKLSGIDFMPPIISDVLATSTTATSSIILWNTDEYCTGEVFFGTSTKIYDQIATGTYSMLHSVALGGLQASTTYFYYVLSIDSSGNTATSGEFKFVTADLPTQDENIINPVYDFSFGEYGTEAGEFNQPRAIELNSFGDIYTGDLKLNSKIQKFNNYGNFLSSWGEYHYSFTPETFDDPDGIAIDDQNNIYVADNGDARNVVQKFDENGLFITSWGCLGADEGCFLGHQTDIAIDSNNNLYVTDNCGKYECPYVVHVFGGNGDFLRRWAPNGINEWELKHPVGIAIDQDDYVYIIDYSRVIYKFDKLGNYILKWGIKDDGQYYFNRPTGIAADENGNIFISDILAHKIFIFNSEGEYVTEFGVFGIGEGEFYYPQDLTVKNKKIYITDSWNNRVDVYNY